MFRNSKVITFRFDGRTQCQMFLVFYPRHVGAHLDGHKHGVSINLPYPSFLTQFMCYVFVLCVMSQISHNIRVALQSDLWMRSDISIYRRRWQPLSVHPAHLMGIFIFDSFNANQPFCFLGVKMELS